MKNSLKLFGILAGLALTVSCAPGADALIDSLEAAYADGDQAAVSELSGKLARLSENGRISDEQTVRIEYLVQKYTAGSEEQPAVEKSEPEESAAPSVQETEQVTEPADTVWNKVLDEYESSVAEYLQVSRAGSQPEGQNPENIVKGAQLMQRIDSLTMVIEKALKVMNDDQADRYGELVLKFTNSIASE